MFRSHEARPQGKLTDRHRHLHTQVMEGPQSHHIALQHIDGWCNDMYRPFHILVKDIWGDERMSVNKTRTACENSTMSFEDLHEMLPRAFEQYLKKGSICSAADQPTHTLHLILCPSPTHLHHRVCHMYACTYRRSSESMRGSVQRSIVGPRFDGRHSEGRR